MFYFLRRKLSDIQAPTLLNNVSQYSSVANMTNNNCDVVENSMLGCVNLNANREVLPAAVLIDSNPIEKVHTENSRFEEISAASPRVGLTVELGRAHLACPR
jgi:hypothetical protein